MYNFSNGKIVPIFIELFLTLSEDFVNYLNVLYALVNLLSLV